MRKNTFNTITLLSSHGKEQIRPLLTGWVKLLK
jgi:hypothetical protein